MGSLLLICKICVTANWPVDRHDTLMWSEDDAISPRVCLVGPWSQRV